MIENRKVNAMSTFVPPIKCQGIKTKLVPFIQDSLKWDGAGTWIEPFLGSGVVLFNIQPQRAIVGDRNEHIIRFYQGIQTGLYTPEVVRNYLEKQSPLLIEGGVEYYYEVRRRFNEYHDPLDLLFLNRSCFNGIMRFNKSGGFNVPFCKKPERFSKAYITKIVNQVAGAAEAMKGKDWEFRCDLWQDIIWSAREGDCVYLDPPYIGRDTNYVGEWSEEDAVSLADAAHASRASIVALSMWKENKYRKNDHLNECWADFEMREYDHFYHVGASESLRNKMVEALMIRRR